MDHNPLEALATSEELVRLRRTLVASSDRPAERALASALMMLASDLASAGRNPEGLVAASESVELYRSLEHDEPGENTSAFAMALWIQGALTYQTGDRRGSLTVLEESATLYRSSPEFDTVRILSQFADVLAILANVSWELGMTEQAVDACSEKIEAVTKLATMDPNRYMAELPLAMMDFASRAAKCGHKVGMAHHLINGAIDFYRRQREAQGDVFGEQSLAAARILADVLDAEGNSDAADNLRRVIAQASVSTDRRDD